MSTRPIRLILHMQSAYYVNNPSPAGLCLCFTAEVMKETEMASTVIASPGLILVVLRLFTTVQLLKSMSQTLFSGAMQGLSFSDLPLLR